MLTVFSDLHIGAIRSSGTTPASSQALRSYVLSSFEDLMYSTKSDCLLNGDVFDSYNVPLTDLLGCYNILSDWLTRTPKVLYVSGGNHDFSKDSSKLSSMEFLGALLLENFGPERVVVINEPTMTPHGYVIPHLLNQETFDAALAEAPPCDVMYLHCNVDNPFAVQSDHSLNITSAQLKSLPCEHVVCGHEHQQRTVGKCVLPGNQIPTSIADCLNSTSKYYCEVADGVPMLHPIAQIDFWYKEVDWRSVGKITTSSVFPERLLKIADLTTYPMFLRVVGSATAEEGVQVAQTIADLRRDADSFVVSNAVQIASVDGSDFEQSLEDVKGFDVMSALKEILTSEEIKVLEELK